MNTAKLHCSQNPLAHHFLAIARQNESDCFQFNYALEKLAEILLWEAAEELPRKEVRIHTPLEEVLTWQIVTEEIVLLPILRAGLALLSGARRLLPNAAVGLIAQRRDEETFQARELYHNLPSLHGRTVLVLEPMLATGGTLRVTLDRLIAVGAVPSRIIILTLIAAPEGVERIQSAHPESKIYTIQLDRTLNTQKFILPGLGDAGDRWSNVL